MGRFLLSSIVASVVLTAVLNIALRFRTPDLERWFPLDADARRPSSPRSGGGDSDEGGDREREPGSEGPRVRVFVPWKAMLVISIGLTVVLNAVALLAR